MQRVACLPWLSSVLTARLPRPRRRDRFWQGDDESREALLPRAGHGASGGASPRRDGYHTPPSRFQSPYTSPARMPASGPLAAHAVAQGGGGVAAA